MQKLKYILYHINLSIQFSSLVKNLQSMMTASLRVGF